MATPPAHLVAPLLAGPVDIVGDVHGEIDHLEQLIGQLGYRDNGTHPEGRRLIFVGDLTDRGPDSPAVVRRVRELVDAERAQCVLGNHELNILRHAHCDEEPKSGNEWITLQRTSETQVRADDRTRQEILDFFGSLPLALERSDLRVVHACWDEQQVDGIRGIQDEWVTDVSERFTAEQEASLQAWDRFQEATDQEAELREAIRDPNARPPLPSALAELRVRRQNEHPIKVLTSGKEAIADAPHFAGGRWRFERRLSWWDTYGEQMVVVGHYWRPHDGKGFPGKGPSMFEGIAADAPLGRGHVMCVDFAVGYRSSERARGLPQKARLAAYRWGGASGEPELVFSECSV